MPSGRRATVPGMATIVAFLRGINVGGVKRVAMADLRALVENLGYADVRTHLQSGNVVFGADAAPEEAARAIEAAIAERLGLEVTVVARTADELAAVVAEDPLAGVAGDPARHLVVFLDGPDPAVLAELGGRDYGEERLVVREREIHLWCPGGVHRSRAARDAGGPGVARIATARNWRTLTKLLEMARPV